MAALAGRSGFGFGRAIATRPTGLAVRAAVLGQSGERYDRAWRVCPVETLVDETLEVTAKGEAAVHLVLAHVSTEARVERGPETDAGGVSKVGVESFGGENFHGTFDGELVAIDGVDVKRRRPHVDGVRGNPCRLKLEDARSTNFIRDSSDVEPVHSLCPLGSPPDEARPCEVTFETQGPHRENRASRAMTVDDRELLGAERMKVGGEKL